MAEFRLMRKMTALLDKKNTESEEDPFMQGLIDDDHDSWLLRMNRQDLLDDFRRENDGITERHAEKILQSAIKRKYIQREQEGMPSIIMDEKLKIGENGDDFLFERWGFIPTGMFRVIADENFQLATLVISFIAGIVIGALAVVLS